MRRLLCFFVTVLLGCAPAFAQTQVDLGTQTKGQLPPANASAVIDTATQNAISAVYGAGTSVSSGMKRGSRAMHGFTERFSADMRCAPGSSSAMGFDQTTGNPCVNPGFYHGTGNFDLERTLRFGTTNALPPSPTHFGLVFSAVYGGSSNAYVGMSTCALGTYNCGSASEIGVSVTSAGFTLQVGGNNVAQWGPGGTGAGSVGSTDNGNGNIGFGPPSTGAIYGVSLLVPGDGTAIFGVLPISGALCYTYCNYIVRVQIAVPSGSFHSFFVRGGAGDFIGDVAYADGYNLDGGNTSVVYDVPTGPLSHVGVQLRFALHANGSEWDYRTPSSDLTNAYALVSPGYNPDAANPFAMHFRGQENSDIAFYGTVRGYSERLFQSGYVQGYADISQSPYYGSPADLTIWQGAYGLIRNALALTPRPVFYADSGGGIVMSNVISHGLAFPTAAICVSCNLSLSWDANAGNQMTLIENDYGFSIPGQYAQYTSPTGQVSYDPVVAASTAGTGQNRLTAVPMLFIADAQGGDATVDVAANTTAMAAALNAARPGSVTVNYVGGGHVSVNKFNAEQAMQFFLSH